MCFLYSFYKNEHLYFLKKEENIWIEEKQLIKIKLFSYLNCILLLLLDSWVNCNDSKVKLCSKEDVLLSQAYILVYTKTVLAQLSPLVTSEPSTDSTYSTDISNSADDSFSQKVDDDITFNFKSPLTEETTVKSLKRSHDLHALQPEHRIIKRRRSNIW